jgi:hypothetical protein
MKRRTLCSIGFALVSGISCTSLEAQNSLAARVAAARDGVVRFRYTGKPGVCGDGAGTLGLRRNPAALPPDDEDFMFFNSSNFSGSGRFSGRTRCMPGPVQVSIDVRAHRVENIRTTAGPVHVDASSDVTDLGEVSAPEAAKYLVTLAVSEDGSLGKRAILPAALADSAVIWPELLRIGRDERISRGTRKAAIFWVGQEAADAATAGLKSVAQDDSDDVEIRKQAVFALSQRPKDEGIPALISVVGSTKSREVKRNALFWLAESNDPRAVELFEKILTHR